MSLPGRAKAPRPLRRQVGGSKARGIYLLGVAATLGLGCNRAPQGPVLGDPDPGTVYPVFEVRLHEGSLSRTVSLPYVAPVTAEPVLASFEFQFPDSVVGTAAYLAVSVDDRAEVTLNGAILGAVEDVGELELGVCYPSVPLRIALRCSAYAEPARLRGVWLIVRPGRVRQLRLLESELARFLELPFQRWEEWEWRPSSGPGAQWKRGGLGLTWSGSGEKRWFRTRLPWPSTVNGFLTNGDSLWLRLAVDDSATVFVDGRLVGAIRRQGGVPLGHRWEGEQEILVEVTNRRGRGSFEGAWIGSGRLAALRPQLDSLLRALYRYRLLLEQHPDPPSDWESAVSRALREIREALASEPRECSSLGAALGRAWPHLSRLEIALRQFPPFVCGPYLQNVGPHQITV
ncbi:MAG: hypothetical protein ONB23_11660, partial [candidate division KSB1 bacterium]|nr:hypothetical protein [candidate division KSB1 bacterium]